MFLFLRKSDLFLRINQIIKSFSFSHVFTLMERRKAIDIFNYQALSEPLPMLFIDKYPENNLYGMSYVLGEYIDSKENHVKNLDSYIEHGLFFGNYVNRFSYLYKSRNIITFGDYRKEILLQDENINERGKSILPIGPYILYAQSILPKDKITRVKRSLGKTLLVFPTHSIANVTTDFDNDEFVQEIESIRRKNNFDTVIISLYWKDIIDKPELCEEYIKFGYKITCSGHKHDIYFLNRQRSIIELSDMTMSNEVGTHVGYCVSLGKPHYVYSQDVSYKEGLENVLKAEKTSLEDYKSQQDAKDIVKKAFSIYSEFITDEQRKVISYYWGSLTAIPRSILIDKIS